MSTSKMKEETLIELTLEIVNKIEEFIPLVFRYDSISDIHKKVEENVFNSKKHKEEVFRVTTGIGMKKYITRRIYTLVVENMTKESFNSLKQKEKVHGIHSFKSKCIKEFPFLKDDFDISKMQQPLDKQLLYKLLREQLEIKSIDLMMDSIFKDITKKRELIDVSKSSSRILIQENDDIIVDLDKSYFKKNNIIFNISGKVNLDSENNKKSKDLHSANIAISNLSKFYNGENTLINSIFICTEWCGDGFGIANLIDSIYYTEGKVSEIELSRNKFISFEEGKVWLNTDFYINKNN